MRKILMAAFVAATITPAEACNDQLFSVLDWRASAQEDGRNIRTEMEVALRYDGELPFRMIHAAALFSDVLGNALLTVQIDRDQAMQPGDELTASGTFIGRTSRIDTISTDDVESRACVWSIVYEDGTVETFD